MPWGMQVMTVYAVAIGEPNFGIAAPFAVGLSLLVSVQAGGKFTGEGTSKLTDNSSSLRSFISSVFGLSPCFCTFQITH